MVDVTAPPEPQAPNGIGIAMIPAQSERGEDPKDARSPSASDQSTRRASSTGADATPGKNGKPKKRRKVNHGTTGIPLSAIVVRGVATVSTSV